MKTLRIIVAVVASLWMLACDDTPAAQQPQNATGQPSTTQQSQPAEHSVHSKAF